MPEWYRSEHSYDIMTDWNRTSIDGFFKATNVGHQNGTKRQGK